jgi:hypothetical protein
MKQNSGDIAPRECGWLAPQSPEKSRNLRRRQVAAVRKFASPLDDREAANTSREPASFDILRLTSDFGRLG